MIQAALMQNGEDEIQLNTSGTDFFEFARALSKPL